jgi:hypothetical protein
LDKWQQCCVSSGRTWWRWHDIHNWSDQPSIKTWTDNWSNPTFKCHQVCKPQKRFFIGACFWEQVCWLCHQKLSQIMELRRWFVWSKMDLQWATICDQLRPKSECSLYGLLAGFCISWPIHVLEAQDQPM